ncbi:MAG: PQQ-like beta-propeller repeat protein, partial [Candidatus Hydrogenedentes bacterium]|nr:PQQ-like beta-propeller repeat protein [Candidatus Hydrogenedentota bacterium]
MKPTPLLGLLLLCTGCAGLVHAEEWPQWRGLHRDGRSPETQLLKQWPAEGPPLLWQTEGVGEGHASLAVSGDRIFTTGMREDTSEGVLSALELDGAILWQTPYGPEWNGTHPGARSCPTVDEGRLYILSGMARLLCCRVDTGEIVWFLDLQKQFGGTPPRMGFAESLLVVDNKVICTPGGERATLAALDKITGEILWSTQGLSDIAAYCSPILVSRGDLRLVVTITERHLAGIDVDSGEVVWKAPFDTEAVDPNHAVSPVYDNGRIY